MLISRTLRLFLDSIGRRDEYEFYLRKFQSDRSICFALVAPDTPSVEQSGDLMTFDLQFLLRLDLTPLVVLAGAEAVQNAASLSAYGDFAVLRGLTLDAPDEVWRHRLRECCGRQQIAIWLRPELELGGVVEELAPRIARRIHLLRAEGMLAAESGDPVFYHCTRRANPHVLRPGDQTLVDMVAHWLERDPHLHVSVASPLHLLQEMFTVRGKGSVIRPGSVILHYRGLDEVDEGRLLLLVQEAFGRTLRDPASLRKASDIYVESRYRGAAILEDHPAGKYLSKFAVGTQARGEGLAQELWDEACAHQPALFWRSRVDNPINQWYDRQATGRHREGRWTVFWKGIPPERLPAIIAETLSRPSDFVD